MTNADPGTPQRRAAASESKERRRTVILLCMWLCGVAEGLWSVCTRNELRDCLCCPRQLAVFVQSHSCFRLRSGAMVGKRSSNNVLGNLVFGFY